MGLLMLADHRPDEPEVEGMRHSLFTDPQRRARAREMILQKRGMGHAR